MRAVHRVELGRHIDDAAPALLDHHRRHTAGHLIGGDVIGLDGRADDIVVSVRSEPACRLWPTAACWGKLSPSGLSRRSAWSGWRDRGCAPPAVDGGGKGGADGRSGGDGGQVSVVAQRHGISKSLLYNWRLVWKTAGLAARARAVRPTEFVQLAGRCPLRRLLHSATNTRARARRTTVWRLMSKRDTRRENSTDTCEDREGSSSAVGHAWTERREGCCDPVVPIDLPRPLIGGSGSTRSSAGVTGNGS